MATVKDVFDRIARLQNVERQQELQWEGSFEEYLQIVLGNPGVTRTAFQRLYDMILSHGVEEYTDNKKRVVRYKFFTDPKLAGRDCIFGLDIPLMKFVNILRAAAQRYGPERRVLLLHGPVGSSKSTIVRLLKRGLEKYSRTPEGALYSFAWVIPPEESVTKQQEIMPCPMHEEPLRLVPEDLRPSVIETLGADRIEIDGDLCPACRQVYRDLLRRYQSDWTKMIQHVRVRRLVLSEKDRVGVGTFQPKDEKNQDSTELTGDINYRKIAEYGTDSDPRAFNFDGEFNIANRGLVEFIEVLKLDVAFLYDLLGASQEHKIKPKKFSQTDIDEVIVGHSVAGHEPLPYRYHGRLAFTTMADLYTDFQGRCEGLEVLAYDFESGQTRFTPVRALHRHRFTGEMLTTVQAHGVVETTPNHSIYGSDGRTFFPENMRELMAVRDLAALREDTALMADALHELPGLVSERAIAVGYPSTRPSPGGWLRHHDLPASVTGIAATFELPEDADALLERVAGSRERFETPSRLLAAQVGTLASLLGKPYTVKQEERHGEPSVYRLVFGTEHGGSELPEPALHRRHVFAEWVYDIECEGLHNFVCGVGNVVCHNTNEPEYRKLQNNEFMEALRDRTAKVDIPYITKLDEEIKIYKRDFNQDRIKLKHIAPHTVEMASMWAVLTRLEEPRKPNLTIVQKLKLYNGKSLSGFTEDNIKELRKEAKREGMEGISPRYIQDKISNALVSDKAAGCINPFMVMNELESGLRHHSLITSEDQRKRYTDLLGYVKQEYEDIAKNEVQRAISADEEAIRKLCANYIDHVKAYTQKEKVKNKYTGQDEEPDERLMRSIEEKIDIHESRKDDFRREIMNYIGALAVEGKTFDYRTNERLHKALELKLFEDQKDSIKLTTLVSSVVDRETQEKIDIVKSRLIKNFGYCDICSTDVLNYVASIFARGDVKG